MSDVLDGVTSSTPIEEIESSMLEDVAEVQSIGDDENPPASSRVPTEILHHIYKHLHPKHVSCVKLFNASGIY